MTPRKRTVAALSGKIPDRVPCAPLVATLDRQPDIDGVSINIGLSDGIGSVERCEIKDFRDPRMVMDEYLIRPEP